MGIPTAEETEKVAMFREDDLDESETEQFKCVALQHHTRDYLATVATEPKMVIYVHIPDKSEQKSKK